jgi:GNAT superfamily N-acetyltransferase
MTLIVRAAIAADLTTIVRFNTALALEIEGRTLDPERLRRGVEAVLEDAERGRYYIAEEHGRTVGQVLVTFEWSDWRNGYFWWLQNVYVTERSRGKGVFQEMFNHLNTLVRSEPQVCGLRLYVARGNSNAQQASRNVGMADSGYLVLEIDRSNAVRGHSSES